MVTIKHEQNNFHSTTHLHALTYEQTIICTQLRGGLSANESKKKKKASNEKLNYCEIKDTVQFLNYVLFHEKRIRRIFKRSYFISDTWPINLSPDCHPLLSDVKYQ